MSKRLTSKRANQLIAADTEEISSPQLVAQPLVSVYFITYQHASFVREALDSVLAQKTDFDLEIVIGEDGSTDGTFEIVSDYAERFPEKIRLLHSKEGLGKHTGSGRLNAIRNLKACRGKYIAFLEGDDYWTDPLKLQKQVDFLEVKPEHSACAHLTKVLETDGTWGDARNWWQTPPSDGVFTLERIISLTTPFHTTSFLVKRSVIQNLPKIFLSSVSGDLLLYHLAAAAGPIYQIPEAMSVYRKHGGGVTDSASHSDKLSFYRNRWAMFDGLSRSVWRKNKDARKKITAVKTQLERNIAGFDGSRTLANRWKVLKVLGLYAFMHNEFRSVTAFVARSSRRMPLMMWSVTPSPVKTLVRSILK